MQNTQATDAFEDHQKQIFGIVHNFIRKFGGDFDELVAEANLMFMKAFNEFDPEKSKFSTYLHTVIYNRLLDLLYADQRHRMMSLDNETADGTTYASQVPDAHRSNFSFVDFAQGLSKDASTVLQLLDNSPEELAVLAIGKGGHPRNWRSSIREYLADVVGWNTTRIAKSFLEIQGALNS